MTKNKSRYRQYRILACLFSVVLFMLGLFASQTHAQIQPAIQLHSALQPLQNNTSHLTNSWDDTLDTPRYLSFENLNINWQSVDTVKRSYQFLNSYKQLYKISNPDIEFKPVAQHTDSIGMTHIVLQQYVNDVPVYNAKLTFHFRLDGSLSSLQGTYIPYLQSISTQPKLNRDEAIAVAKKNSQQDQNGQGGLAQLVVYDETVFGKESVHAHLIWRTSVGDYVFYIDAQTGKVLNKYSDTSEAYDEATYVESVCNTVDTLTYDETGLVGSTDDTDAAALHSEVENSYNYFVDSSKFDIDNILLDSTVFLNPITSYTHWVDIDTCADNFDAAWSNSYDFMYFAQGVYGQDIVAHELTHGVIHHTVAFDYTSDVPAALNESYADIFGTLIQYYSTGTIDWVVGENLSSTRSGCSQGVRDLSNPSALTGYCDGSGSAQPNEVSDLGGDYSDEHAASNIPNYAFYLLAEGGTHPDSAITVSGIGIDAAEQIYTRVISDYYISSNATFEDAYLATFQACQDLNQVDPTTYPFSYCESVYDAFQAVGITSTTTFLHVDIQATPTDGYAPLTVDFDGSASQSFGGTITDYEWDLDSSIDSDSNGSVVDDVDNTGPVASSTYDDPKTLNARLTITDSTGNFSHDSTTITVNDPLEPTFSITGDGATAPATVTFDASSTVVYSGAITNYSWNFGDGNTTSGTSATASHEYTTDGYYTVTLTITTDTGYNETYSHMVYIGSTASGGSGATEVSGTMYNDTWTAARSPYVVGTVYVAAGQTLTIEPGTVVKFSSFSTTLNVYGSLIAQGTESEPIVFTSYQDDSSGGDTNGDGSVTTPAAGDWEQIEFMAGSGGTMSHTVVQYGGNYHATSPDQMISIDSSDVTIENSYISTSEHNTIEVVDGSPTISSNTISSAYNNQSGINVESGSPLIENNTFTDNTYGITVPDNSATPIIITNTFTGNAFPIYLERVHTDTQVSGNTGSSNTYNGIFLAGQTYGDVTLEPNNDLVYISDEFEVRSGDTTTIAAGTIIKFKSDYNSFTVSGTLSSNGSAIEPVVFTSITDDTYGGDTNNDGSATTPAAGDWEKITFASGSVANLSNTTIQYGGYYGGGTDYPMVRIFSDDVTIDGSTLSNSAYHNIEINSASPTVSNSVISSAPYDGIYITGGNPQLASNTIADTDYGIYVDDTSSPTITLNSFASTTYPIYFDTFSSDDVVTNNTGSTNEYNGIVLARTSQSDITLSPDNDLLYIFGDFLIPSTYALTLEPGLTTKFLPGGSISVYGTFLSNGTTDSPVVLTSTKDDTYGGDTNNDSSTTAPARGDWAYVNFTSGSSGTIANTIVQYGGSAADMFIIASDNVTIDSGAFAYSSSDNIYVNAVSPTITNSTSSFANGAGLMVNAGSPTVTNNTMSDNGSYGLCLYNAATPSVSGNMVESNYYGVYVGASGANPTFSDNSITDNSYYGFYNSSTTTITAENNSWGDSSGPYQTSTNPTGTGDRVSDYVDYDPWTGIEPTALDTTPPADVTLGTIRKDVWTPSVTLNWINPTDTDFDHVQVDRTATAAGITTTLSSAETGTSYIDSSFSYNLNYTYTLYACDTSSNCSTGVTTASQRVRNPSPTGLTLTAGNMSIGASWTASSAPASTLGGYKVYYGTSATALTSVVDVGNVTSTTLTGLTNGTRYYVAVSAYSRAGVESTQSASKSTRPHL